MKKYELIKESKTIFEGIEIYRIRALKDFGNVKAGDVGGWVCSEDNLSQNGNCWIYDNAKCLDDARVYYNAKMYDNAIMCDDAIMYDNSRMFNNTIMYNNSRIFNNAKMYDNAMMYNNTRMFSNAIMGDNAIMYDDAIIGDNAKMFDNSRMYDDAIMYDNAILDKDKLLYGSINKSYKKIFQYHCEKRLLTAILTEENEILYSIGCQIGITKKKFIDRIYNDCKIKGNGLEEYPHRQEYLDIIDIAESYLRKFI